MRQNLIFEQKVYKDPLRQKYYELSLKNRQKSGIKVTVEDMITTVSNLAGKSYEQIAEQSIYQLYADFKRISKDKEYDTSVLFKAQIGGDKINIGHFAEYINMFEEPYSGRINKEEGLSKLNSALEGK